MLRSIWLRLSSAMTPLNHFIVMTILTFTIISTTIPAAWADITGTAFRDYNANGSDDGVNEPGIGGVVVNAYDASGATAGNSPQTTAPDGSYTITGLTGPVRLEFTLPTDNSLNFLQSGASGTTSVIFANDGDTANVGFNNPDQYCQSNPDLATTCFVNGDPSDATGPQDALIRFNDTDNGRADRDPTLVDHIGTKLQLGSVWGAAYDSANDNLYVASMLKRHVGMGPGGPGAIYQIAGAMTAIPGIPTEVYDLTDHAISVGAIPDNATRGVNVLHSAPSTDAAVFPLIGKAGLGDIELDPASNTLYVVNLADRTIYAVDTTALANPPTALPALPDPGCNLGEARPWALKHYDGLLYAGVTCTGETGGATADLSAHLYTYDGTMWSASLIDVPLDYAKGSIVGACSPRPWRCRFNPWLDTEGTDAQSDPPTAIPVGSRFGWGYPQPLLADIEIDNDGSLILGFTDRNGHQYGPINNDTSGVLTGYGVTGGDILRICNTGSIAAPNYVIEGDIGCATNFVNPRSGNGSDFYDDNATDGNDAHEEIHIGGLALLPGSSRIVGAVMDATPFGEVDVVTDSGGVQWLSNTDGSLLQGLTLFQGRNPEGLFGKGAGIGDVEFLCQAAPLELGNRVWCDGNSNGIQDPGEVGINGATVTMTCDVNGDGFGGVDDITDMATTSGNGDYLLGSTNFGGNGVPLSTSCRVTVDPAQAAITTACGPDNDAPTQPNNGGADPAADLRDSDGVPNSVDPNIPVNLAGVSFTTGGPGANNHSYDFGFTTVPMDYGDAPDTGVGAGTGNYRTIATDNGPSHVLGVPNAPYLGVPVSTPTTESNKIPEPMPMIPGPPVAPLSAPAPWQMTTKKG